MRSVVDRENLVRKIQFPRLVIPLAVVLLASFNLGLNLIVVLIFALIEGVTPMLSWLELPLIVAFLAVFTTGIAMLLSALFVQLPRHPADLGRGLADPLLRLARDHLGGDGAVKSCAPLWLHVYMLNPLAVAFQQFRHAMITHGTPSPAQVLGGWAPLVAPT